MSKKDLIEYDGFEELNQNLKKLDDRVKRIEVLRIFRRIAKTVVKEYRRELPLGKRSHSRKVKGVSNKRKGTYNYKPGNLKKSVKAETVPSRYTGGNPSIAIRPYSPRGKLTTKKGSTKTDGYYRFMVIKKGVKTGGNGAGSRSGVNTVVDKARDRAIRASKVPTTKKLKDQTEKYIQKQIDKLSK